MHDIFFISKETETTMCSTQYGEAIFQRRLQICSQFLDYHKDDCASILLHMLINKHFSDVNDSDRLENIEAIDHVENGILQERALLS